MVGRLAVLEELGLAERTRPGGWRLDEGWQSALKELGERGEIIKRIHGALPQPGDGSRYLVVDGKSEIEPIEGILRRKGLHDEFRGDMYGVVEDAHGQAHYVPIDGAAAEPLKEGHRPGGGQEGVLGQAHGRSPREGRGRERRDL